MGQTDGVVVASQFDSAKDLWSFIDRLRDIACLIYDSQAHVHHQFAQKLG